MAERIVFDCELQALSDYLFPKMAPARSINPYSVQTVTSFRGEQRPAKACTPFAAIAKFRIEFSAVPQNLLSTSAFPFAKSGSFTAFT
jgi:hypothetical protein